MKFVSQSEQFSEGKKVNINIETIPQN